MKKLLLSLFAVATIFVACDKEDSFASPTDTMVTNGVEQVDGSDIDIDGLIDRLTSSTSKNGPKSTSITSKDAVRGSSHITLFTSVVNGYLYEIAFDDTVNYCDNASGLTELTLTLDSSGGTDVRIGDENGFSVVNVPGIEFLFTLDINQALRINAASLAIENSVVTTANVFPFNGGVSYNFACATAGPVASWNMMSSSNGITTYAKSGVGTYTLQSAPFPLTGFLATVTAKADAANVVANYAGTTSGSVTSTIQNDFEN